jgi:hypothetical protein
MTVHYSYRLGNKNQRTSSSLPKKNFKGEVWAMTSFADEEWIEDEGYEKLWTENNTFAVKAPLSLTVSPYGLQSKKVVQRFQEN